MSKRYPPAYSIVALIVFVTVTTTNTNGAALYVASTMTKMLNTLTSNIANYLGFVLASGWTDCDRNGFCSYGERKEVKNAIS